MDDQSRQRGGDETWFRLREWTKGQAASERLAATLLQTEGYAGVDPSHPLGGKDGGKDGLCRKDGLLLVFACYFPRGQQDFKAIESKFDGDFAGVAKNGAEGLVFVTNQELTLGERKTLQSIGKEAVVEIYHLERLASVLNTPKNYGIRFEYLDLRPTDAEYLAFLAFRDEEHYRRLQEVNGRLDVLLKRMEDQTADLIGYATGGDSVAYFQPRQTAGSQRIEFHLINLSRYPVFDIRGWYVDLDERVLGTMGEAHPKRNFAYPSLYPSTVTASPLFVLNMTGRAAYRIDIFIQTRNTTVRQKWRVFREGDHFLFAELTEAQTGFRRLEVPASVPGYDPADPEGVFRFEGRKQPDEEKT